MEVKHWSSILCSYFLLLSSSYIRLEKKGDPKDIFWFLLGQSWNFIFWFRILSGQNFLTQSSGENILSGQNLEKLPFPSQKFVGIPLIFTPKLKVLCIVDIFSQSVSLTECVVFCVCLSVRLSVPVSFLVVKQCFC